MPTPGPKDFLHMGNSKWRFLALVPDEMPPRRRLSLIFTGDEFEDGGRDFVFDTLERKT